MRRSGNTLLTMVAVAVTLSGCSDQREPTATGQSALKARTDRGVGTTFTSIDPPGSTLTLATDINARGQVVGRYLSAGRTHGFLRDPDGAMTTIDYPGSNFTVAGSINNSGTIPGWYSLPAAPGVRHGFLLRDGVYTSFDPPGSTFTNALGINERGIVVGRFCTLAVCRPVGNGDFHGFVYDDGVERRRAHDDRLPGRPGDGRPRHQRGGRHRGWLHRRERCSEGLPAESAMNDCAASRTGSAP